MRSLSILFVFLFIGLSVSGCATVFTGTHDEVTIRSEPEGATIYVDGLEEGVTPATLDIKRPGVTKTEVTLQLDGYEPTTFVLRKEFNAVSVINLACVLCWAVDVATGSITKYRPSGYDIALDPDGQAYLMDDLLRDEDGRYLIPDEGEQALINMPQGLSLVFFK